jgi:hypothetical protein
LREPVIEALQFLTTRCGPCPGGNICSVQPTLMAILLDPVADALTQLRASVSVVGRIVHEEILPAQVVEYAAWPPSLDARVIAALAAQNLP